MRSVCVLEYSISPARSVVIAPLVSRSSVYPQTGQTNRSTPSFIPSCLCPHIGHTAVEGKKRSTTIVLGSALNFDFSVPRHEFCTCLPKSPLCHPWILSSCMTSTSCPSAISWNTLFALSFLRLVIFSYSLRMSFRVSYQPLEPFI